jgi:hypothetical protein
VPNNFSFSAAISLPAIDGFDLVECPTTEAMMNLLFVVHIGTGNQLPSSPVPQR